MYSRIVGTGKYLPERDPHQRGSREDGRDHGRVDQESHRHRVSAHRRRRRSDERPRVQGRARRARGRGPRAERHRPRVGRHDDARSDLPERRLPRAGEAQDQELSGVQPRGGVLGIRVQPRRRRSVHQVGTSAARARHRRRDDVAHHRLDRSRDLRAVRRRRRRRDPRSSRQPPASSIRRSAPMAAIASCCMRRAAFRRAIASQAAWRRCA